MQQSEPIMNIVFLVDICIDKKYQNGSSPLDIAKSGIRYFIQVPEGKITLLFHIQMVDFDHNLYLLILAICKLW